MPDETGRLSQAEQNQVMQELRRRFPNLRCPVSGSANFNLHDYAIAPVTMGGTGNMYPGGGTVIPQIMIISDAGFVMYFSAIMLGLAFQPASKSEHSQS
jgi:hypothetical protein